jgi:hypothetical protein
LYAENHLLICERILPNSVQKLSKFLLEIIILVSSANVGIDDVFVVGGRSFICFLIPFYLQSVLIHAAFSIQWHVPL